VKIKRKTAYGEEPTPRQIQALRALPFKEKVVYAHLVRIRWPRDGSLLTSYGFLGRKFNLPLKDLLACMHGLESKGLIRIGVRK